ncbi:hypothetical protein NC661_13485 [Aquibacillus koreensis]|uniref:Uncharacterized protein n=1 Tax=Aquibacillus koreensis TaxID=279446 RepID=A0A9X3WMK3_9BACI|nr:hypothetical protein [Aquibacillus koreensis]MCT2536265.1 hypothetical protein [Aquibacillus koreensis]MDC3421383.1 hypothetical protein [Aquibacillus koreensis]
MKQIKIIIFIFVVFLLSACSSKEEEETYSIILVSGEENISEQFTEYTNFPIIEYKHVTNLKAAQEKYPKYDIEQAPAILIFEDNGAELKKLEMKTYDIEEAIEWLEDIQ